VAHPGDARKRATGVGAGCQTAPESYCRAAQQPRPAAGAYLFQNRSNDTILLIMNSVLLAVRTAMALRRATPR